MKPSRVNNMSANSLRREPMYELILNDMVLMGLIDSKTAAQFIGREVSEVLKAPNDDRTAD